MTIPHIIGPKITCEVVLTIKRDDAPSEVIRFLADSFTQEVDLEGVDRFDEASAIAAASDPQRRLITVKGRAPTRIVP